MNRFTTFRSLFIAMLMMLFSLLYIGCGGSEEAMSEDEMVTDTGENVEETPTEQQAPTAEEQAAPAEEQPVTTQDSVQEQQTAPSSEQLQAELDSLKTENVQLQGKVSTTEQNNQELMAKISDLEAANMAMQKKMTEQKPRSTPAAVHHSSQPGKSSPEEIREYKGAVAAFNAKKYADAVSEFQTLLNSGIKDDFADNCQYWIGLSNYQMKEYSTALAHFQQVMNYRFSEKKDDAQLMIARTYERLGNREKAVTEYKRLVDMYPTSEYVAKAKSKLK